VPGIGRAARKLADRVLPKGERVWVQVKRGLGRGLWLKADPYRELGYLRGVPEAEVQEMMQQYLRPGGCFFDVGSHIGFYALIGARLVGEYGHVVAFEPEPDNFTLLEENVRRNGFSQVVTLPVAVWRESGRVPFRRGESGGPRSSTRRGAVLSGERCGDQGQNLEVEAFALDDYTQRGRAPDFIKVDVEGGEKSVIDGARRLLEEVKPAFLVEVHHESAAEFLTRRFTQKGYELRWLPTLYEAPYPRHLLARPCKSPTKSGREIYPRQGCEPQATPAVGGVDQGL